MATTEIRGTAVLKRPMVVEAFSYLATKVYTTSPVTEFNPPRRPTVTETQELLGDDDFMRAFRRGVRELDRGEGVGWEDLKADMGL